MLNVVNSLLASVTVAVPDSGMTVVLVSAGVLTIGLFARFVSSRKK